jgi:hypothetical protein
LNLSSLLFDAIRNKWVSASPEELVRQKLLNHMLNELGYPRELLVVEKQLSQLPHLTSYKSSLPDRRADIICYGKDIHPDHALYPLLLIECKEERALQKAVDQVLGYNYYVQAYFVALVDSQGVRLGYYEKQAKRTHFISSLPPYAELLKAVKQCSPP